MVQYLTDCTWLIKKFGWNRYPEYDPDLLIIQWILKVIPPQLTKFYKNPSVKLLVILLTMKQHRKKKKHKHRYTNTQVETGNKIMLLGRITISPVKCTLVPISVRSQ